MPKSITTLSDIEVGDIFYFIPSDRRELKRARKITVTKVGRDFIYCDKIKFRLNTLSASGSFANSVDFYPNGGLYADKDDWIKRYRWQNLCTQIQHLDLDDSVKNKIIDLVGIQATEDYENLYQSL